MKLLLPLCLVLCLVATSRLAAQIPVSPLVEISPPSLLEDEAPVSEPRHVACGVTSRDVEHAMKGAPDDRLSAELWVYWNFRAAADRSGRFTALVVYFKDGRVAQFRLVERKALVGLIAALRSTPKAPAIAAK